MDRRAAFDDARAAFVPDAGDSPEAIPYYRAFIGLQAAWGDDFARRYDHIMHQAGCWAGGRNEDAYEVACSAAREIAEKATIPERPKPRYVFEQEPQEPTEAAARAFFNRGFKRAFPRHRANSKLAHEKWAEKRDQALAILRDRWAAELAAYATKVQAIEAENARATAAWQAEVDAIGRMRADVAAICK